MRTRITELVNSVLADEAGAGDHAVPSQLCNQGAG